MDEGPTGGATPHLTIRDRRADEAIASYAAAFGAREARRSPSDDGRLLHAALAINGGWVMLHDDFPEFSGGPAGAPTGVIVHLQVDDADRWFERALGAGGTVRVPIGDQFWGDRYGQVVDPFDHVWSIGAPIADPAG